MAWSAKQSNMPLPNISFAKMHFIYKHIVNLSCLLSFFQVIPVGNRFQLLDDATSLLRSDDMDIETLLNLTLYLDQELEYIPWSAATYLVDTTIQPLFRMRASYGLLQVR